MGPPSGVAACASGDWLDCFKDSQALKDSHLEELSIEFLPNVLQILATDIHGWGTTTIFETRVTITPDPELGRENGYPPPIRASEIPVLMYSINQAYQVTLAMQAKKDKDATESPDGSEEETSDNV
jgi:hypothetical protein